MRSLPSIDAFWYRAALYLYPPAFRHEFSTEMARDFNDARQDAQTSADARRLWVFRLEMATDLACAALYQWLRTGLPVFAALSITGPLLAYVVITTFWKPFTFEVPLGTRDADEIALMLLIAVVLLVILSTVIFTAWLTRQLRRRRI